MPLDDKEMLDAIDEWHKGHYDVPLHEYLGMDWESYCVWVQQGKTKEELQVESTRGQEDRKEYIDPEIDPHPDLAGDS